MVSARIPFEWSDAELLIEPSFAYPLFTVEKRVLVKRWGFCRGLVMRFGEGYVFVEHEREICLDYAKLVLDVEGPRADPDEVSNVEGPLGELCRKLFELYRGFTVFSSPLDDVALFAAIHLSRNTDFHNNTAKWVSNLLHAFNDVLERAAHCMDPEIQILARSSSYQLQGFPQALREYLFLRHELLAEADPWRVRKALLRVKNVGPKIADAYLLFVKRERSAVPADRNLAKLLERFGVSKPKLYDKRFCMNYRCDECPFRSNCLRWFVYRALGKWAGLFQTLVYLQADLYCNARACYRCPLKELCFENAER